MFTLDCIITEYRAIGEQGHFSRRPYRLHWKAHTQIVNSLPWTNVYRVRLIFTSRSRSLSLLIAICAHSKQRLTSVCGLTARHRMEPNDLGFIGFLDTFDSCAGENGWYSGDFPGARLECRHRTDPTDLGLLTTFDSCAGENGCDSGDFSGARLECPCAWLHVGKCSDEDDDVFIHSFTYRNYGPRS